VRLYPRLFFAELLFASIPAILFAQSPQRLVDDYIKALGGVKALRSITSTTLTGRIVDHTKNETGSYRLHLKAPNQIYTEILWPRTRWSEGFNGKSAWRQDPDTGLSTLTGPEGTRLKTIAAFRNDHLLSSKKEKTRLRFLGREEVNGSVVNAIEVTTRAGLKYTLCFDLKTSLLIAERDSLAGESRELILSKYRTVDGVREPFRLSWKEGSRSYDVTLTEVSHNTVTADGLFDIPKISSDTIPAIASLLEAVTANQKHLEDIVENYTYTESSRELEVDKKGAIKDKSEEESEVFYVQGNEVKRLIRKDGRELNPGEQKKEQERVTREIREIEERHKKEAEQEKRGKKKNDEDQVTISTFLKTSRFVNPRRERFRGHEVVVFDFEPKPGVKPQTRGESLVQKLVGVVWIDEHARQVARLEARLSDSFKVAGGMLVTILPGSAFVFEQELVNNEVWLPSNAEVNISGKFLLFKSASVNLVLHYSQYKKFNIEMLSDIKSPTKE
jgi:gas vesicle protein